MFGTGFCFGKVGLNGPRPGKYRHIGLPLAPGTSLGAAQGGGYPGSAVMGRRPAARGLPWVRRTAKDFPNVSAPSAKRGDSVKFARSYATPTKKLNLRFFGYFLLIMGFIGVWGERGRGEAIEDS